jgi:hypothetical protein
VVLRVDKRLEMELEEDGFLQEEGSSGSKHKRQRTFSQPASERNQVPGFGPPNGPANAYTVAWMQPSQP